MEMRRLGQSGLHVSLVGLGCNNFGARLDIEGTRGVIHRALDRGITLFDTSDSYSDGVSESQIGHILGARRKDIVLASKFGSPMGPGVMQRGGSRHYIMQAVEASLKRLQTDWIDLYQFHRPDPATPLEETLRALDDLVRQGKVRYIGISNHPAWRVVESLWIAKQNGLNAFVTCQDEYSLLSRQIEAELVPAMQANGLGILPYFPLASGLLTGKYHEDQPPQAGTRFAGNGRFKSRYWTKENWHKVTELEAYAKQHGQSLLTLAFSWLAAQTCVSSVIAGATKPEQIDGNVEAVNWVLTAQDLTHIDQITR
jgi:aryl-alcohol dehydrogenase-like predicted oxidoreductase